MQSHVMSSLPRLKQRVEKDELVAGQWVRATLLGCTRRCCGFKPGFVLEWLRSLEEGLPEEVHTLQKEDIGDVYIEENFFQELVVP